MNISFAELEGALPGSEANAMEAPNFKEADKDKDGYRRKWELEANTLSTMHFLVVIHENRCFRTQTVAKKRIQRHPHSEIHMQAHRLNVHAFIPLANKNALLIQIGHELIIFC